MHTDDSATTPYPQATPLPPQGPGLVTSSVRESPYGTSDQPTLASLFERAAVSIPDGLISNLIQVASSPGTRDDRAADCLRVMLSGREKCLKVYSRTQKPTGALAANYRRYDCPDPTSPPMYRPKKAPCDTRAHDRCERRWAQREVKKRGKKLTAFTRERGGTTLLAAEWVGTDTKVRGDAWRAFRRSLQRPDILERGIFCHVETAGGRRSWLQLPKVTDEELSAIAGLWSEVTQRHTGSAAECFVVERALEPVSDLRDMADHLAAHEARNGSVEPARSPSIGDIAPSVDEVAVALYLLARKAVLLLTLEGAISLPEGLIRFSHSIWKDAATFGAEMKEVDADGDTDVDSDDHDDQAQGDPEPDDEGGAGSSRKPVPCPLHPGEHLMLPADEAVDFTKIERWMLTRKGYELPDGTFVLTGDPTATSLRPEAATPGYKIPPPSLI